MRSAVGIFAARGFTFLHLPTDSFTMASAFSVNDGALVAVQLHLRLRRRLHRGSDHERGLRLYADQAAGRLTASERIDSEPAGSRAQSPAVWVGPKDSLIDVYGHGRGTMAAISDDGIAVGTVEDTVAGVEIPVIWTRANGLQRLPGLEHSNLLAKESGGAGAINKVHQVLGTIMLSTGQTHVVIWSLPDTPMLQAQIYSRHATLDRSQ